MAQRENPLIRAMSGEQLRDVEIILESRNGDQRKVSVNGQALVDDDGWMLGAVVAMHDVTEQKRNEERLAEMALHDPLTGLANRTLLAERLQEAIDALARQLPTSAPPGEPGDQQGVAVFLLDLDEFKEINDVLGHDVGDDMLVAVARRLSAIVRPTDTVARLGGDEFVVVCDIESGEEEMLAHRRPDLDRPGPALPDRRPHPVGAGLGGRGIRRQPGHRSVQAAEPGRRRHVRRQVESAPPAPIHGGLTGWWTNADASSPLAAAHRPGLSVQPVPARWRPGPGPRAGPGPRGGRATGSPSSLPLDDVRDAPDGIELVPTGRSVSLPANGSVAPVSLSVRRRGAGLWPRWSRGASTWCTCMSPSPRASRTAC